MSETEFVKIFVKNLNKYLDLSGKTQAELSRDLNLSKTTVSSWFNGKRIPRMDKMDLLCTYFGCKRSDLMEDKSEHPELTSKDTKQIEKIIKETRQKLTSQEGLMFDGDPASPEAIESILDAMELGMEMAKKKNKEKYTPKKYKKD